MKNSLRILTARGCILGLHRKAIEDTYMWRGRVWLHNEEQVSGNFNSSNGCFLTKRRMLQAVPNIPAKIIAHILKKSNSWSVSFRKPFSLPILPTCHIESTGGEINRRGLNASAFGRSWGRNFSAHIAGSVTFTKGGIYFHLGVAC